MEEEIKHLDYTIDKYDEVICDSKLKLKNLKELYKNNYDTMLEEKFKLEAQINSTERAKEKPYFARIDFESKNIKEKCYIGKLGVSDYDNNIITVDWRTPIASLYYDSNVGSCSYEAPGGIIEGNLKLKRQYTIEHSKLIDFNDVDTVSNDELLKPYLNVSANIRLKNIVSTIQSEQNKIIREKIGKNLVVQGVAGSGKTTVALHRIAYLVYNNRDLFKSSDYMVIGPNKFFVNYISSILPDLDVNGVSEYTLEELLETFLNEKFKVNNLLDELESSSNEPPFKVSMDMKQRIDEYFSLLKILPDGDFKIHNEIILSKNKIKELYSGINKSIFKNVKSRVDRMILLMNKEINDNIDAITSSLIKNNVDNKVINELKNNLQSNLKKYFRVSNIKVIDIYLEILSNLEFDTKNIKNKNINIVDIPALMYIKYKFSGNNEFKKYKHIVIDEAQDYGEFTFYVLKKLFRNSTFSIYGDLAQSLYSYRSISDWTPVQNIFKNCDLLKLNKSYRTTIEIMNEANKINKLLNLDEAIPVIRHGEEVEYVSDNLNSILEKLKEKYNTIAVITKTQDDANKIYNELKNNIKINLINSNNLTYDNNINILPSYLSKGLEFDAVIVVNPENKYFTKDNNDLKLLYVSMTRALHKLIIKI